MGGEGVGENGDPGKGGGEGPSSHGPSGIGGGGTGPGFSLGVRGGVPGGGFAGRGIGVDAFGGVIGVCGRGIEGAVSGGRDSYCLRWQSGLGHSRRHIRSYLGW
jgi:hypothetical protein